MKAIIIGGVAAGMSAASKIKRSDPSAEVTVYERGNFLSYGACGLPYYIGGFNQDYKKLIARSREQFEKTGIETHLDHTVLSVNAKAKTVEIRNNGNGEVFQDRYDKLLIAVGCNSAIPPIKGIENEGVVFLKSMEDGLVLQQLATSKLTEECLIVGGGYIGVEMAEAFTALGKKVTLIESAPRILMPFEPEVAELAKTELIRQGVKVITGEQVQEIKSDGSGRMVETNRSRYKTDLILVATGVMPATSFLESTGIRMDRNGAIIVDREMRSSISDIYAAGDCAVTFNKIMEEDYFLPLGTVANKCGRIAGANIAGNHEKFVGALGSAAIKVFDLELARTGMSEADADRLGIEYKTKIVTTYDHPGYYPDQSEILIKLIYEKGTYILLGASAAGKKNAVLRTNIFALAIHNKMTTKELGMVDLAYAPPFAGVWDAVHIAANAAK
ncbi:MAG: hypothetical protein PWP10_3797 [Clostridiales bacterium]|jgi:NADPH-dependent 2,4-dienoyl-CoA reductase/sulfur reductase-like enzyme|nr:hypothetical protein [Clostridiales bacterium]